MVPAFDASLFVTESLTNTATFLKHDKVSKRVPRDLFITTQPEGTCAFDYPC
jgi:hypothetical protein